jgi:hypothetical protein
VSGYVLHKKVRGIDFAPFYGFDIFGGIIPTVSYFSSFYFHFAQIFAYKTAIYYECFQILYRHILIDTQFKNSSHPIGFFSN